MALILQIDTASTVASVSLARHGEVILSMENQVQNEHASFLQPAIRKMLDSAGVLLPELDAIAVANGPGSYTGLRVGLASAKGLAYALNKPIIDIGTLRIMAAAAAEAEKNMEILYAPMIDARRMEVFTAVYNFDGNEILTPRAEILHNDSYVALLLHQKILFFGSGARKWESINSSANALFSEDYNSIKSFAKLASAAYDANQFAELAYLEPLYLKEFYNGN